MQKFEYLIVCGDSYQTPSKKPKFVGTHWSELLAKRRSMELVTLASPGMSDTAISFQIMEAAKYRNALVCICRCAGLRFDLSLPNKTSEIVNHYSNFKSYMEENSYSEKYIKVTPLHELDLTNRDDYILLTKINYSLEELKQQSMIFNALNMLQKQNDNFLFFDSIPFKNDSAVIDIISEKNIVAQQQFDLSKNIIDHNVMSNWQNIDPGYHTLPERQIQIADYVENRVWGSTL